MIYPDWTLKYSNPRNDARLLICLPEDMLRDLHLLAKAKEISAAELIRRAVTREIATEIRCRPELAASFRGTLPT